MGHCMSFQTSNIKTTASLLSKCALVAAYESKPASERSVSPLWAHLLMSAGGWAQTKRLNRLVPFAQEMTESSKDFCVDQECSSGNQTHATEICKIHDRIHAAICMSHTLYHFIIIIILLLLFSITIIIYTGLQLIYTVIITVVYTVHNVHESYSKS